MGEDTRLHSLHVAHSQGEKEGSKFTFTPQGWLLSREGMWEVGKQSFLTLSLSGPHFLTCKAKMI